MKTDSLGNCYSISRQAWLPKAAKTHTADSFAIYLHEKGNPGLAGYYIRSKKRGIFTDSNRILRRQYDCKGYPTVTGGRTSRFPCIRISSQPQDRDPLCRPEKLSWSGTVERFDARCHVGRMTFGLRRRNDNRAAHSIDPVPSCHFPGVADGCLPV